MRINQFLSHAGLGSRRKVEDLVTSGKVFVNGKKISKLSTNVDPTKDEVVFDGKKVSIQKFVYYLLNKPTGFTCSLEDDHAEKLVCELVPKNPRVFPVGRLDRDSEGLIILTNDGDFALKMTHPRFNHEKEYLVTALYRGKKMDIDLSRVMRFFKCGTGLDGYKTRPAKIKVVSKHEREFGFEVVLTEGRKRQIRRVMEKAGFAVTKLTRVRIGPYQLEEIPEGKYKMFQPKVLDKKN